MKSTKGIPRRKQLVALITAAAISVGLGGGPAQGATRGNEATAKNAVVRTPDSTSRTESTAVAPVVWWIGGLAFRASAHVLQRAAARHISKELIEQTIKNGKKTKGNGNTSVYT